jgi:hypothetical protein
LLEFELLATKLNGTNTKKAKEMGKLTKGLKRRETRRRRISRRAVDLWLGLLGATVLHVWGREEEWCGERRGSGVPYIGGEGKGRGRKAVGQDWWPTTINVGGAQVGAFAGGEGSRRW